MYEVGDEVEYVPHMCHAFNCNANNEYPWIIGQKQNPRYVENFKTGKKELVEDVLELDEGRLHRHTLPGINQAPDAAELFKRLVPLRPSKSWPAVVRGVGKNSTLDLDIESNIGNGMITLHYDGVPVDESGTVPHSCRKKGSE